MKTCNRMWYLFDKTEGRRQKFPAHPGRGRAAPSMDDAPPWSLLAHPLGFTDTATGMHYSVHSGCDTKGLEITWVSVHRILFQYYDRHTHTHRGIMQSYKWKLWIDLCRMILNHKGMPTPWPGQCLIGGYLWGTVRRNELTYSCIQNMPLETLKETGHVSSHVEGNWEKMQRRVLKLHSLLSFVLLWILVSSVCMYVDVGTYVYV